MMKQTICLAGAIVLLCAAIVFGSLQISSAIAAQAVNVPSSEQPAQLSPKTRSQDILTKEEAAAYLGISLYALEDLMQYSQTVDGSGIPYYIMDGTVYFSRAALDKWIQGSAERQLHYGEVSPL